MTIVRATDIDVIETPNGFVEALATPRRGAADVSVIRQRLVPGKSNPPHRHDREEVMVMLSGEAEIAWGATSEMLTTGDICIVPANSPHSVQVRGREPAEWLVIATTGIRFFGEDGTEMHPDWAK